MNELPTFTLPSNPARKILLREATVQEAMNNSAIPDGQDEERTTLFLNATQIRGEHFQDARTMSGHDRRFGLFWYWTHTSRDTLMSFDYQCDHCGEAHCADIDAKDLIEHYQTLSGLPYRDTEFGGRPVRIQHLSGERLEELEALRFKRNALVAAGQESSRECHQLSAQLRFQEIMGSVVMLDEPEPKNSDQRQIADAKKASHFLKAPASELYDFVVQMDGFLADMAHGLKATYDDGEVLLISTPIRCPNRTEKEAVSAIRMPFRFEDYIPTL